MYLALGEADPVLKFRAHESLSKFRKNIFKEKKLNVFDVGVVIEEAPETETALSFWNVEFAKQLAAINKQPFSEWFYPVDKGGEIVEFPS